MPYLIKAYRSKLAGEIEQLSKKIETGNISPRKLERCNRERDRLALEFLQAGLYEGLRTTLGGATCAI